MTEVRRLAVSLTKHGAHKIAQILNTYPYAQALRHIDSTALDIHIEEVQARKTLGADRSGPVPALWGKAQALGRDAVNALVMLAIISSHHELLKAMRDAAGAGTPFRGRVERDSQLAGKAYTNFVDDLRELGFGARSSDHVDFDLSPIFANPGLGAVAAELFGLRLAVARWGKKNALVDELVRLGFHESFNVPEPTFRRWLTSGAGASATKSGLPAPPTPSTPPSSGRTSGAAGPPGGTPGVFIASSKLPEEDVEFINGATDVPSSQTFQFKPGHTPRKTGTVPVAGRSAPITANLTHNDIQTKLFNELARVHGPNRVGTEVAVGDGTSIDLVVKTPSFLWFYEIKTADTVKGCIRQAIPQLLEYAYWNPRSTRPDRLFVVSVLPITAEGEAYLKLLRDDFGVPISYLQAPA